MTDTMNGEHIGHDDDQHADDSATRAARGPTPSRGELDAQQRETEAQLMRDAAEVAQRITDTYDAQLRAARAHTRAREAHSAAKDDGDAVIARAEGVSRATAMYIRTSVRDAQRAAKGGTR